MLRFEELALLRRHKLQGRVAVGGALAMEEGASLEQLKKTRISLGMLGLSEISLYGCAY